MKYHQFCPVAKASELLGEKWTFLIIRDALMHVTTWMENSIYSDIPRAVEIK